MIRRGTAVERRREIWGWEKGLRGNAAVPDEEAIEAREVDLGIILGNAGSWVSELSSCKASQFAMVILSLIRAEWKGSITHVH